MKLKASSKREQKNIIFTSIWSMTALIIILLLILPISICIAATILPGQGWDFKTRGKVVSVSLSNNGEYMAIASDNGIINIAKNKGDMGEKVRSMAAGGVTSVKVAGDYSLMLTGDTQDYMRLYDNAGKKKCEYKTGGDVNGVDMSADKKYIAGASNDNNVYVLDDECGLISNYYTGGPALDVAISPDGEYIVAGSENQKVYVFTPQGKKLYEYDTSAAVYSVTVTNDGDVGVGCADGNMYIFNSGNQKWKYSATRAIEGFSSTNDGSYMAAVSADGKLYLMDNTGFIRWTHEVGGPYETIKDAALSPEGAYIAYASTNTYAYLIITNVVATPTATAVRVATKTPTSTVTATAISTSTPTPAQLANGTSPTLEPVTLTPTPSEMVVLTPTPLEPVTLTPTPTDGIIVFTPTPTPTPTPAPPIFQLPRLPTVVWAAFITVLIIVPAAVGTFVHVQEKKKRLPPPEEVIKHGIGLTITFRLIEFKYWLKMLGRKIYRILFPFTRFRG